MDRTASQRALIISHTQRHVRVLKALLADLQLPDAAIASNQQDASQFLAANHCHLIICVCQSAASDPVFAICLQLKQTNQIPPDAGILMISDKADAEMVNAMLDIQPDDFLITPFTNHLATERLTRLLHRKQALRPVFQSAASGRYVEALADLETLLGGQPSQDIYPLALKLKGELLARSGKLEGAKTFYESVLALQTFTWARTGLIGCLIELEAFPDAEKQILSLTLHPSTAIIAYDLLSLLHLRLKDYDSAFEATTLACELSPNNVTRHHDTVRIARLSKDFEGTVNAAQNLLHCTQRNNLHDPQYYLLCARACIDLAMTTDASQTRTLIERSRHLTRQLEEQFTADVDREDLIVIRARLLYLENEVSNARQLLTTLEVARWPLQSDETLIDKAKALHEVGLRQHALKILNFLEKRSQHGHNDEIISAYIAQQKHDKEDIAFPSRALNDRAVRAFREQQFSEALVILQQAFRLMPKNPAIALNLLQATLHQLTHNANAATVSWVKLKRWIDECQSAIESSTLNEEQHIRYQRLQVAMAATLSQ
ncbi:hypothetical protein HHX48_04930 [Salinimonas sp. HHU 13199]|uniref:Response regulatory domain-containing protein n=1 Tax=Salinimonas profundi TaxID=2729140 RepID=A0ABR8LFN3_9ALTE|nr:hypothetical protein [Salinimonas profundi]MBD3585076.1 hypothetical protein [Salinimonas profundi]